MAAKVLLQKNRTGKFTFSLLSARGHVIAASEPYESKRGALAALNAFRKNAADAILVDETQPKQATPAKKTAARAAKTAVGAARVATSRTAAATEGTGRRATGRTAAARGENARATKTTAGRPRKTAAKPPSAADAEG